MADDGKTLARRFLHEAFAGGRLEILDEILAPEYIDRSAPPGLPPGPAGIRQLLQPYRVAFPDLQFEVHDQLQDGDKIVTRWTMRGTHTGDLFGIPATGRDVSMGGISIYRVGAGRLQEAWVQYDTLGLLQQLGAVPAPGAAPTAA